MRNSLEKRIVKNLLVGVAIATMSAASLTGCKLIDKRITPSTIYEPTVISHWQKDFADPEVGYYEEIHFVKFDNYEGCLKDKSMKLRKGDELMYATISKRIIPGGCPVIIDYTLSKRTEK